MSIFGFASTFLSSVGFTPIAAQAIEQFSQRQRSRQPVAAMQAYERANSERGAARSTSGGVQLMEARLRLLDLSGVTAGDGRADDEP